MNYFSGDNQLLIRSMMETDIEKFVEAFAQQQWHKPYELFHSYYIEQKNKTRTVVVAEVNHQPAGYVTLLDKAVEGPFSGKNIPEIVDFNVLMKYQNRGIGSKLMDVTEGLAQAQSNFVSLAVGLHSGYGSAQRMYIKRGYIPDGTGAWYKGKPLDPYAPCVNDDDLILYFLKNLQIS